MRSARPAQFAVLFGAVTIALHTQIEVTGVTFGSAHWMVGLLCLGGAHQPPRSTPVRLRALRVAPTFIAGLTVSVLVFAAVVPVYRWQSALIRGAEAIRPITDIRQRIQALSPDGRARLGQVDSLDRIAADLAALTGSRQPTTEQEFEMLGLRLELQQTQVALHDLQEALTIYPSHRGTSTAAGELAFARSMRLAALGDGPGAAEMARLALELSERMTELRPESPSAWARFGAALASVASAPPGIPRPETNEALLARAITAYERAAELDPSGLEAPVRLATLSHQAGDSQAARRWAEKARQIDENLALDPLAQLTSAQREELARVERIP
jgi:tetratricopeptide (TPR) repeat protein